MDWFLYDRDFRHERVNSKNNLSFEQNMILFHGAFITAFDMTFFLIIKFLMCDDPYKLINLLYKFENIFRYCFKKVFIQHVIGSLTRNYCVSTIVR